MKTMIERLKLARFAALAIVFCLTGSAWAATQSPTATVSGSSVTISNEDSSLTADNATISDISSYCGRNFTIPAVTGLDSGTILKITSVSIAKSKTASSYTPKIKLAGVPSATAVVTSGGFTGVSADKITYSFADVDCIVKVGTATQIRFLTENEADSSGAFAFHLRKDAYQFIAGIVWSSKVPVVEIKAEILGTEGLVNSATTDFAPTTGAKYVLCGASGWLSTSAASTSEIVLNDGIYGFGFKISNGNSTTATGNTNGSRWSKLSGTGTLTTDAGQNSGVNGVLQIYDVSDFTGAIQTGFATGPQMSIMLRNSSETLPDTLYNLVVAKNLASIYVSAGKTGDNAVTIAAGKTWKASKLVNYGELTINGTFDGRVENHGTLTVNGTINGCLLDYGTTTMNGTVTEQVRLSGASVANYSPAVQEGDSIVLIGEESVANAGIMPVSFPNGVDGANVNATIIRRDGGYCTATWNGIDAYTYNSTINTDIIGGANGADLDFTFTNTYVRAYSVDSKPGAVTLNCGEGTVAYNNTYGDKTTALYGYAVPYTQNGNLSGWLADHSAEMTLVIVATMPSTQNAVFFHMGRDTTDSGTKRPGLLFSSGSAANEVVISYNLGNVVYPVTTMKVPNASSARHVYAVTKKDNTDTGKSVITVYLDGTKWKQLSVDQFTFSGNCGVQVGSTFGGQIISGGVDKDGNSVTAKFQKLSVVGDTASSVNAVRLFASELSETTIAKFSAPEEYPYNSPYGNSVRTFTADGNWVETESTPWANTPNGGVETAAGAPLAGSSLTVTADNANGVTVSVNLDSDTTYEALTLNGDPIAFEFEEGKSGVIKATGAITIGTETTIKAGALEVGGATTILDNGKAKLIFDYSEYDASGVTVANPQTTPLVLASMDEQEEGMVSCTPPNTSHRVYSFGYANGGYNLSIVAKQVMLNGTDKDTLAGALDEAVDGDTITLNEDVTVSSLTINNDLTIVTGDNTLNAGAITVTAGSLVFPSETVTYTLGENTVVDQSYTGDGVKLIPLTSAVVSITQSGTTQYYSSVPSAFSALMASTDEAVVFTLLTGDVDAETATTLQSMNYYVSGNTVTKAVAKIVTTTYDTLAAAVGAATDGATVTLLRASSEAITLNKAITLSETANFSGTLTGTGTLTFAAFRHNPTITFTDWTGTVVLPSFAAQATVLNKYGVTGSTVVLKGITGGWLGETSAQKMDVAPVLQLDGNVTIKGFSTSWDYTFAELAGTGNFVLDPTDNSPQSATITKVADDFTGTITNSTTVTLTIGTLARQAGTSTEPGTLLLSTGGTGDVAVEAVTIGGEPVDVTLVTCDDGIYVAAASVTKDNVTTPYKTVSAAVQAVGDDPATITLHGDTTSDISLAAGQTLDTNGFDVGEVTTTVANSYVEQDGNVYSVESYKTVTFVDEDGTTVLQTVSNLKLGDTPEFTETEPTKAATAQYTYTFEGWTPEVTAVTADATYTATYTETVNTYTITWIVDETSDTTQVAYGAVPTYTDPVKQYYTFTGWDPTPVAVDGAATYTATFSRNTVTVTVPTVDNASVNVAYTAGGVSQTGTTADTYTVDQGTAVIVTYTAGEGYFFGNDTSKVVDLGTVTANIEVTAQDTGSTTAAVARDNNGAYYSSFNRALGYLYVQFNQLSNDGAYVDVIDGSDNGNAYADYKIGCDAAGAHYAKVVTKIGTAGYLNLADAWAAAGNGTDTATITVLSDPSDSVTVAVDQTLKVIAGEVDLSDNVSFAEGIKTSTTTEEDVTTYTARDWYSWTVTVVAENATVTGFTSPVSEASPAITFTVAAAETYKVTSVQVNGTEVGTTAGEYNATLTGNTTITVTTELDVATVTFFNEDGTATLQSGDVTIGQVPTAPEAPEKATTAQYTYTFAGWATEQGGAALAELPAVAAGGATYYAVYTATVNNYVVSVPAVANATIESVTANGETAEAVAGGYSVPYGATVIVTYAPAAGYHLASGALEVTYTNVTGAGELSGQTLPSTALTVAKIGDNCYATLAEAVAAVEDGETVTMLADVTLTAPMDVQLGGKAVTLDLGGRTLTGRTNLKSGSLTVQNGTVVGGAQQALNVYGSATPAENYSVLTIAGDVTVTADVYGVCLFGPTYSAKSGYGAVINLAGTVTTTGDGRNGAVFVSGNLGNNVAGDANNIITVTGSITSATDAAIALNGLATVNVAEGAVVVGDTAIAVKRGTLNVTGGTVHATGAKNYGVAAYGNGTEMTGAAISITDTYNKYGPMSVAVSGGVITSDNADALFKKEGAYTNDATMTVTGGEFSSAVPEEYCAPGFICHDNGDGTYTVKVGSYVALIGEEGYETLAEAVEAADDGDTIQLLANVTLDAQIAVTKTLTLDMGGNTIKNVDDIWDTASSSWSLVSVQGGNLTITGNGKFDPKQYDCYALDVRDGGSLTIVNGTFIGNISAVYVYEGSVNVQGGSFDLYQTDNTKGYAFLINMLDSAYRSGTASAKITGGVFHNWDPQANTAESTDATTDFTPNGYIGQLADEEGWMKVVEGATVTWQAADGTVLATERLTKGTTPSRVAPGRDGWTFQKWTPAIEAVTNDVTYKAFYSYNDGVAVVTPTLPPAATEVTTIVTVPGAMKASELIVTEGRPTTESLVLKAFDKNTSRFYSWAFDATTDGWVAAATAVLDANGNQVNTTVPEAEIYQLTAGQGVWVTYDPTVELILSGDYTEEEETSALDTVDHGYNMVAPVPKAVEAEVVITDVVKVPEYEAETPAADKDVIVVPTAAAPTRVEVREGGWKTYKVWIDENGEMQSAWVDATIPAGTGFWYINRGNTKSIQK